MQINQHVNSISTVINMLTFYIESVVIHPMLVGVSIKLKPNNMVGLLNQVVDIDPISLPVFPLILDTHVNSQDQRLFHGLR